MYIYKEGKCTYYSKREFVQLFQKTILLIMRHTVRKEAYNYPLPLMAFPVCLLPEQT